MNIDPRIESPESGVDSGDRSPSAAGSPSRPAPAEDATPEVGANGGGADGPAPASGGGLEREFEGVVDGESIDDAAGAYAEAAAEAAAAADPEAAAAADVEAEAEVDLDALTARAEKADEYLRLAQRTQADFENYRKRAAREAGAARERGAIKLALELLPAVDNLERALAHATPAAADADPEPATFVAGIQHVHTDVLGALKRVGIEAYSPEGETFDPHYHEAVAQAAVDGAPAGTVVEVFQRGYRLGETVLRPARVVVAG